MKSSALANRFETLVRTHLCFLEEKLGFQCAGTEIHLPEVWTTFQRANVKVVVTLEIGSAPWVILSFPNPRIGGIARISLEALVGNVEPESRNPSVPAFGVEDPALVGVLEWAATQLQRHAEPVLLGDEGATVQALQELERRGISGS